MNPASPDRPPRTQAASIEILSRSETPPFQVDEDSHVDESLRLKYRYLDLRRGTITPNLKLRHKVVQAIRRVLDEHDFLEIETPNLTRPTPEGARDYLVPSRVKPGSWYALPQSPQLYKQLLMMGGLERYFQIARCFRDEDLRADRQPEFTQLDLEMSFVEEEDVIEITEAVLKAVLADAGIARGNADRAHVLRRGDGSFRQGRARPPVRTRDPESRRSLRFERVQSLRLRPLLAAAPCVRSTPENASSHAQTSMT